MWRGVFLTRLIQYPKLRTVLRVPTCCYSREENPVSHHTKIPGLNYTPEYSSEQQEEVLQILNGSNAAELAKFNVSKVRVKNLSSYRKKHGDFRSLEQVLEVDGFGVKMLENICNSILSGSDVDIGKNKRLQLISPYLSEQRRDSIHSAVGMRLGFDSISWAHIKRGGDVLDWDTTTMQSESKRLQDAALFEAVLNMKNSLPSADVYVLEGFPNTMPQPAFLSSFMHLRELKAMLLALLNSNFSLAGQHQVFFMKSRAVGRLFKIQVGSERVSGQSVLENILDGSDKHAVSSEITMPMELRERYQEQSGSVKEQMCQALFLTMAFFDLIVYRRHESLDAVSR